jgi:hypothetical protein
MVDKMQPREDNSFMNVIKKEQLQQALVEEEARLKKLEIRRNQELYS